MWNDIGNWILGYSKFIGSGIALHVELWAILIGLNLAYEHDSNCKIIIESDSSQAMDLLLNYSSAFHPLDSIVLDCRYLLSSLQDYKVVKIARQQNSLANALANKGRKDRLPLAIYQNISMHVLHLHRVDNRSRRTNSIPSQTHNFTQT